MNVVVHIFVLIFLLAISSAAHSEFRPEYFLAAPHPYNMELETDASSAKTQDLGPLGGKIEIEGERGTIFSLTLPVGALRYETPITITTLKTSKKTRADFGRVLGIHIFPEGVELLRPAVLTIVTRKPLGADHPVAIAFQQSGKDASATLMGASTNKFTIPVLHFSGAAILEKVPDTALSDLLKTVPSRNTDRILHGAALAGLQEQRRGGNAEEASQQYLDKLSLYTKLAAFVDLATFQAKNDSSGQSTCKVAFSSKLLVPMIELALAHEAIKIINSSGPAGSGLSPTEIDNILESVLIRDDEVFPTAKKLVDLQNQCLKQFIDACYNDGLFVPLESVHQSLISLTDSSTITTSSISGRSLITVINESLPRIDPHLRTKAEQIAGWVSAFDKTLDSAGIGEVIKKHLERCARFEVDLEYNSKFHVDGIYEIKEDGAYSFRAKEILKYNSGVSIGLEGRLLRAEYRLTDNFSHCKNYVDTSNLAFSAPMTIRTVTVEPKELGEFEIEVFPGVVITHLAYHDICTDGFEYNDGGEMWSSVIQSSGSNGIPVKFKSTVASPSYPVVFDFSNKGESAFERGHGTGVLNFDWRIVLRHKPGARLPFP